MSEIVKFSYIFLCFLTAMASYFFCHSKRDWVYLAVGMAFTLISDYFLVLFDNRPVGFSTFCVVHIAYILRVGSKKNAWVIALTIIGIAPLFWLLDQLVATACLYTSLFIHNIVAHIKIKGAARFPRINRALMIWGIILFALCDINVLIYNLPYYLPVPQQVGDAGYRLIWVFYTPAQGMLAASAFRYGKRLEKMSAAIP